MLVTARLSKRLFDQLGEDLANDLVELFNQVDSTSRSELRELNELNFARFDAKLEQRVSETGARIDKLSAEVNARIDTLSAEVNARIDTLSAEVNARIEKLSAEVNARIDKLAAELNARIGEMASKADLAQLEARIERRFGDQTREFAHQFTAQQRFLYFAMAMQIAATLSLWLR